MESQFGGEVNLTKKEIAANFTVLCHGSDCKVITISAADFIKSFRNCIEKIKLIYETKEKQYKERIETTKKTYSDTRHESKGDLIDAKQFESHTSMASPTVKNKLCKMLGYKKKQELKANGEILEGLARDGNNTAKTVIGISNQMNLHSVSKLQKKMNIFDPKAF